MNAFVALVLAAAGLMAVQSSGMESTNSTELYEVPTCTTDQLNAAQVVLTTESNTLSCEQRLGIQSGMLLQSADVADELCEQQDCLNALRTLYRSLPNCRYQLWGLKYSASKFLNHCGIDTNATSSA